MRDVTRAVAAEVDAFRPAGVPPFETIRLRHRARARRRRAYAVAAPLAVGALTLAAVVALPSARRVPPAPAASPSPAARSDLVVAVRGGRAVLLPAGNLDGPAVARAPLSIGSVAAVTAVGDGTFYAAASDPDDGACRTELYRLDARARPTLVAGLDVDLRAMAVDRAGALLAYYGVGVLSRAERARIESAGGSMPAGTPTCVARRTRIRTLATGAERAVGTGGDLLPYPERTFGWSPDSRYLLFPTSTGVGRLDAAAASPVARARPGDGLLSGARPGETCRVTGAAYLGDGDAVAIQACVRPDPARRRDAEHTDRLVRYDAATGLVGSPLAVLPAGFAPDWLVAAPAGPELLVGGTDVSALRQEDLARRDSSPARRAYRWDGQRLILAGGGARVPEQVAW